MSGQTQLRERDLELGTVDAFFSSVRARRGRRLLIQGPAGIGKTALLEAALAGAEREGLVCLTATAPEVGAQVAFAVVREALGPRWRDAGPAEDPSTDAMNLPAVNAAAQIVMDLAEEQPVLVCVDDVQWADAASLRWLTLLTRRLQGAALGIVLGFRTGELAPSGDLMALVDDRRAIVVRPAPLSAEAAGELIGDVLGQGLSPDLVSACHLQTGGNPYLLTLLAGSVRQTGTSPGALTAAEIAEIGARGIAESVERQLVQLDAVSRQLAEVVAVTGEISSLAHVAQVAGIDHTAAIDAVRRLKTAGLLKDGRTLEFVHPLVAAAVRARIPSAALLAQSQAAADLLIEEDRIEEAAALLLELPPRADASVAQTLLAAASRALGRGAPDVAITLLDRALAEPPPAELGADVWAALGRAQMLSDDPRGATSLERAAALTDDDERLCDLVIEQARALQQGNRSDAAVAALNAAQQRLSGNDPGLVELLEINALHYSVLDITAAEDRAAFLEPWRQGRRARTELGNRLILSELTHDALMSGAPAQETVALAERALAGGTLLTRAGAQHMTAAIDLAYAGQPALAREHFQDEAAEARRNGDVVGMAASLVLRADTYRLEGDMVATEVDARTGFDLLPHGERGPRFMMRALIEAVATQGRTEEAAELLRVNELTGELYPIIPTVGLLYVRALVRRQQGSLTTALEDLRQAGELEPHVGFVNPWPVQWRLAAAEILQELGELDEARELVTTHLERAVVTGMDEAIGSALRVQGNLRGGEPGRAVLAEAVARLERGSARLELARALVDLGAAEFDLSETGAVIHLERGMRLAAELGASPLAAEGERRLLEAGSRPRRVARRGAQSLTASEQRAARLAAEGLTNREIAQTLVLSEKTIESHLASTFRKLGIRSRLQLADVLEVGVERQGFSG